MQVILVIEDNVENMYLLRFLLRKNGFDVIEAYTGEEGVEVAISRHPDLILVDIQLSGINGLEAVRQIRSVAGLNKTPIIAVTSFAMTGDREKALEAGCDDYIEKPIDPETFVEQIRIHMS